MLQDWLGNPMTASDAATVAGVDAFVKGFLGYENGATLVVGAADADPECAIANAYAAMAYLFLESPAGPRKAAKFLARAEAAAPRATERERMVVAAVRAWADDDIPRAIALGHDTVGRFPRELATAKATQYHHLNLGDAGGMLRVAHAILPANAEVPYAHGMAAFAFEQSHMLREAEDAARTAIRLQRKEPWAHHALAHVLLTEARNEEGRAFMEDVRETWTDLNSFMLTHNWWHLSLFMIEQGDAADVLDHYASHIWGIWKQYSQDQVGAVSLLARLELAGVDVGDRWQDVADYLVPRTEEHVQPFLDLHYVYGLARAGRPEAGAMLESLRRHAAGAPEIARMAWQEVAVPTAEGLVAYAAGDYAAAARRLLAALPRMSEIGGSHAQRDLFDQLADDAVARAGWWPLAQNRLEQRRRANPRSAPTLDKLAVIYRALGLPGEAARLPARG